MKESCVCSTHYFITLSSIAGLAYAITCLLDCLIIITLMNSSIYMLCLVLYPFACRNIKLECLIYKFNAKNKVTGPPSHGITIEGRPHQEVRVPPRIQMSDH